MIVSRKRLSAAALNDYPIIAEVENSHDYDEMSARPMTAIQQDTDRRFPSAEAAA
jgi:hypothetical protein